MPEPRILAERHVPDRLAPQTGVACAASTLHWDAAHGILRDVLATCNRSKLDNDDNAAVYAFENGARIITAVNTPLTFTPAAGVVADDVERPLWT